MRTRSYVVFVFALSSAVWLAACNSTSPAGHESEHVVQPDEEAARAIESSATSDDFSFQTAEKVDGVDYGLVGDGITDNTLAFQSLLGAGNRTIHIAAGDYVTGKLSIPSNTVVVLDPGVTIRDSGHLEKYDRLLSITGENVRIEGLGAKVIARRADYTSDEWRHGVYIFGAKRVLISGLESSGHGGDGFYIGGPPGHPSMDIYLKGVRADNNRRQGLSITSARRVRVVDSEFVNTNGTAPEFGIDLEPNNTQDFMDDIVLLRPQTRGNYGGGIMIQLLSLDASSYPTSVTVLDHQSEVETPPLNTQIPKGLTPLLQYGASG